MQREITPTSPQYPDEKKPQSKAKNRWPFLTLILALCFGFLAGFLGQLISANYPASWPWAKQIINSHLFEPATETIIVQDKSAAEKNALLKQLMEKNGRALLSIYPLAPSAGQDYFQPADCYGQALILTSDGWLVTLAADLPVAGYQLINQDQRTYQPQQILVDQFSGLTFLKIEAQNLPVVEFAESAQLQTGQEVALFYYDLINKNYLISNNLANLNYQDNLLQTTDRNSFFFLLQQPVDADYLSAPLLDLDGKVIGLVGSQQKVWSATLINLRLSQIISAQKITQFPYFLSYYNNSSLVPRNNNLAGALLVQVSPASLPLQPGDLILKVDNIDLNEQNNLAQLLQQRSTAGTITFNLVRGEETIDLQINL